MKLLVFGVWIATVLPCAICQESQPEDRRLHMETQMPATGRVRLTAVSIDREAPALNWSPSVIHLKGNVEIKSVFHGAAAAPQLLYVVVHADAADYHEETGAIEARGDVHVTFEPQK